MDHKEENSKLLNRRDVLRILREKKAENEEFRKQISNLNTICTSLSTEVQVESERNETLKKEVNFRKLNLQEIELNYKSLTNQSDPNAKKYSEEMRNKSTKKKLESLLDEKIPEAKKSVNKPDMAFGQNEGNEFRNLVNDHVLVSYKVASDLSGLGENQTFRISGRSTFRNLKEVACQFWNISNTNEHVITDDAEAIIYNELISIDEYLKDYSVLSNQFKLVSLLNIRNRFQTIGIQDNRMKENNKINFKGKREIIDKSGEVQDGSIHKIKDFFNEYEGLKPFSLISNDKGESGTKEKQESNSSFVQTKKIETSFWMLLIIIIFFVCTLYIIFGERDVGRINMKVDYIKKLLDNSDVHNYKTFYNYIILTIGFNFFGYGGFSKERPIELDNYLDDLYNSLNSENVDHSNFFRNDSILNERDENITIFDYQYTYDYMESRTNTAGFILGSAIRLIMTRAKKEDCVDGNSPSNSIFKTKVCYDYKYTKSSRDSNFTIDKVDPFFRTNDNIKFFFDKFLKFKTPKESGVDLNYETLSATLDGSGYHVDLDVKNDIFQFMYIFSTMIPISSEFNKATNQTTVKLMNNIDTYFFVDKSVRNLMFLVPLYFPNEDLWMSCAIGFDFYVTGAIVPSVLDVKVFQADILIGFYMFLELLRLIIILIYMTFIAIDFYEKRNDHEALIAVLVSSKTLSSILLALMFFVSFFTKFLFVHKSTESIWDENRLVYKDVNKIARKYKDVYIFESIIFLLTIIKVLNFAKLNDYIKLFYTSIEGGLMAFFKYFVFFFTIIIGYACIAMILWGGFLKEFSTFFSSLIQIMLLSVGYLNPQVMMNFNTSWTIGFLITFYIFVVLFMYTIFMALFAENLRKTVVKLGYPQDCDLSQWKLKDYVVWLCYCIGDDSNKGEQEG